MHLGADSIASFIDHSHDDQVSWSLGVRVEGDLVCVSEEVGVDFEVVCSPYWTVDILVVLWRWRELGCLKGEEDCDA